MTLIDRDFPEIITRSGSLASPSVFSLKSRRGLFSEPQLLLKISNALGIAACAIPAQFFIRIPMTYGVDYTCPAKIEQSKLYNITDISAVCKCQDNACDEVSLPGPSPQFLHFIAYPPPATCMAYRYYDGN